MSATEQPLFISNASSSSSQQSIHHEEAIHPALDPLKHDLVDLDATPAISSPSAHSDVMPTAGIPSSMISICNTMLGSGMLALPNAIASVGALPGALLICLFGCASGFGLFLLGRCAAFTGRASSFNAISKLTYPKAAIFFDLAIAVKCFGVGVSYLVIIGDLMPQAMHDLFGVDQGSIWMHRRFWISIFMTIIIPLSFLRRLDSLKYTSFVALVAVLYLFMLVIYLFFDPARLPAAEGKVAIWSPHWTFFSRLPIFVFAFTCHQNLFAVYNELIDNTPRRINFVIWQSILIALAIYLPVGLLGYQMYGDDVKSNMLKNFPASVLVTIARLAITILVMFSFPLQCHPSRASLDKVIHIMAKWRLPFNKTTSYQPVAPSTAEDFGATSSSASPDAEHAKSLSTVVDVDEELPSPGMDKRMSQRRFILLTSGIIIASYILAFFLDDLGKVLELVGATGSTTICYILPGLFYLKLKENDRWRDPVKLGALVLTVAGCIIMPVCVVSSILTASPEDVDQLP